ncbi:hypothetical protein AAG906_022598 [Vitis piasezkii]
MELSESFQVASIVEKLPPSWKDFKNYLKHKRKEMGLEGLIVRLKIEEDNHIKHFGEGPSQRKNKYKKFARKCYICNKQGHRAKDYIQRSNVNTEALFWKEAINSEIESIMHNHTWKLVDLPPGNKHLGCKWIFKKKMKPDGTIDKYKARLVAKGFKQKESLDFFDTYSPVTRITSIRVLIAIAALHNLEIHQMDVKTTFLNGELEEEIYMEQPSVCCSGQEKKMCK